MTAESMEFQVNSSLSPDLLSHERISICASREKKGVVSMTTEEMSPTDEGHGFPS